MDFTKLLEQVKQDVITFFREHEKDALPYHNLEHTQTVVSWASQMGRHYQLNERDFFVVVAAAWFHDVGYYVTPGEGHELRGCERAAFFLGTKTVPEELVKDIHGCILATRMPQRPLNLLEEIVCDADLFHLGTDEFSEVNKKVREETEQLTGKKVEKGVWRESTIALLEKHEYKTEYARDLLNEGKRKNIERLKEKERKTKTTASVPDTTQQDGGSRGETVRSTEQNESKKKQKAEKPERGIETMFRISSNNHQRLSDMADNKAHIMITTTSIIMSVLISVLLRRLEEDPHLAIPTISLLAVSVVTMVFSILATRPNLPKGTFTTRDVDEKKVNLLFFGNFYAMPFEAYNYGMQKMMEDREYLYGSLIRDVYSQGIVLGKKYKLLRMAYNIFMLGVVVSVVGFVVASIFRNIEAS